MGVVNPSTPHVSRDPAASERLDSWKEIAAYLKRDESTVRRWEDEGLPVHRLPHKKKATVYAFKSELDVWWSDGRCRQAAREWSLSCRLQFAARELALCPGERRFGASRGSHRQHLRKLSENFRPPEVRHGAWVSLQ